MKKIFMFFLFGCLVVCGALQGMRKRMKVVKPVRSKVVAVVPYKKEIAYKELSVIPLPQELFGDGSKIPVWFSPLEIDNANNVSFNMSHAQGSCQITLNLRDGAMRFLPFNGSKKSDEKETAGALVKDPKAKEMTAFSPDKAYRVHFDAVLRNITIYCDRDRVQLPQDQCCARFLSCLHGCYLCARDTCCKDKNQ